MNKSRLHSLRNIAAALLACAGFASCTQDELTEQGTPLPIGQYPLELTAGGLQAVATPAQPATRGTMDSDWDGVTKVKVRVNDQQEKEYSVTPSEDNKTAFLTPADPLTNDDVPFWWQSTTETKTVTAWAPSRYVLDENISFPTKWEKDDFAKYDIIGVRKDIGFEDRNKPLEFRHLMAKVVINLRRTDYLENAQKVDVQLLNMYGVGRLRVAYDSNQLLVDSWEGSQNVTPYHLPAETYEEVDFGNGQREKPFASYMALVIPANSMNIDVLQIEVDGVQYLVTKEALGQGGMLGEVSYEAGKVATINITVKENELNVTVNESISWDTNGASGEGSVTLPEEINDGEIINKPGDYILTGNITSGVTLNGDGINLTLDNVTANIGNAIKVTGGSPTLIVKGTNNNFNGNGAGILIGNSASITIKGATNNADNSKLTIKVNSSYQPGIGCADNTSCGNITIENVTLDVTGGTSAYSGGAAIGTSGNFGSGCGDIKITNSIINATGGPGAAAIGMGDFADCGYSIGEITITDSRLTIKTTHNNNVNQDTRGAGIGLGGGPDRSHTTTGYQVCGKITITTTETKETFFSRFDTGDGFKAGKTSNSQYWSLQQWSGITFNGETLADGNSDGYK